MSITGFFSISYKAIPVSQTDAILKRLSSLHPKLIDLGLERTERLLEALGRPQDRLPPVIHIAGTNGKGSTTAYLRAMLEAAGKKVHVYTSPHLVNFRERIRLAGKLVTNRKLNETLERCEAANAGENITFFEITTVAALLLFSEVKADYVLLEVGLGGEFDTTNVINPPLGAIITPVSVDHTGFLGDTVGQIAVAKAGILKRGSLAVFGWQQDEGLEVLNAKASQEGIRPFIAGQEFDGYEQNGRLIYQDENGLLDLPKPALIGQHQIQNASVCIAAVRHFGLPVSDEAIAEGLRTVEWPARLTRLNGALNALLPHDNELWLDGGHNAAGAAALNAALSDMNIQRPAPLVLIVGMLNTKDASAFFHEFQGRAVKVFTVPVPGETASLKAGELAKFAKGQGFDAQATRSIKQALSLAGQYADARVVICGSLYLGGAVLKQNKTPPQ